VPAASSEDPQGADEELCTAAMFSRLLLLLFFSLLLAPALPVSDRLASAGRLLSSARVAGRARAAVMARAADAPVSGGEIICTQFLKAGFRSMFVIQDDPLQSAEDENGLCDLCVKVVRYGVMCVNDARYRSNFKQMMRDRACRFEEPERTQDCKLLTETILGSQSDWFGSDAAKLSSQESNDTLSIMINSNQKSEVFCRNIRCCRRLRPNPTTSPPSLAAGANVTVSNITNITSNSAWANYTPQQQLLVVVQDRAALTRDKDLLDAMKDNLDRYQHQLNGLRTSLVTKEQTLSEREKLILTGVLRERMIAKARAMEELAAAEAQRLAIQQELDDKHAAGDERLAKEGKPRPGAPVETPAERDARIARMKARKKKKLLEQAYAQEQKKKRREMAARAVQAAQASSQPSPPPPTAISFRSFVHPPPPALENNDDDDSDEEEDADESDAEP